MKTRSLTLLALLFSAAPVLLLAGAPALAQSGPAALNGAPAARKDKTVNWPTYNADLAGSRYLPLAQIDASNFKDLEIAWRFKTDMFGSRPEYKLEGTPLAVDGVLYTTAGTRRAVVALNAVTGELLWSYSLHEGKRSAESPRALSGRGLSYWTDGTKRRILYTTIGYRLISLDADTGQPDPDFGDKGMVDLKKDWDQEILDLETGEAGAHSAPAISGNTIIIGAAFREGFTPKDKNNTKGYVRAFDVRTGKRLWTFHTIPKPGEFGYESWYDKSADTTGNAGVWTQVSIDPDLNLAYLNVESPTSDFYGGHRRGPGLFGNSIVAVDLTTGQRKWHYQLIHHEIWDLDNSSAPLLMNVTVDGKPKKVVGIPSKQGFFYVLDRATGKPVWPIKEVKVPAGTVPGEWYSPTQPIPTKPAAYGRNGYLESDLIDFTPELKAKAVELVKRYQLGPVYTPADHLDQGQAGGHQQLGAGRHQLAGRVVRSGNRHCLCLCLWHLHFDDRAATRTAGHDQYQMGRRRRWRAGFDDQGSGRRCRRRQPGTGSGGGWQRRAATGGRWPAADEAALWHAQRHRHQQGRDQMADRPWRNARFRAQQPGIEGRHHPAHRPGDLSDRHAGDQIAGHRR
jgi:quinoprotein glucose dehydrogenase